jgi:hypothetical protein
MIMLHNWFAVRSSGSLDSKRFRRLELEALEDRMPPALLVGGAPSGPYVTGGSFQATPGTANFIPQGSPMFDSYAAEYPTYFRGYYYSSDAYTLTVPGAGTSASSSSSPLGPGAAPGGISSNPASAMQLLGQMQQLVGTLSALVAAQTGNPSQVLNLAVDEFFAVVDASALAQAQAAGMNTSAIQSDLAARQTAIQNNPVDQTPIGQLLGTAVHDTALYTLAINQG